MTARRANPVTRERLCASPNFALAHTMDGRPYVAKEVEPYIQYWLSDRYRILLSLFSGRGGENVAEAVAAYLRLAKSPDTARERSRLLKAIGDMRSAGVLVGAKDDTSRYDARMAEDYLTHRPFPAELCARIIRDAAITKTSRVLDLAGGPGSLALALARASSNVSLMELSRGFVAAARRHAKKRGVNLTAIHESCNRLVYQDEIFDVITVSQALHWLDDVLVCRGVCRSLSENGSFFVIQSALDLDDRHPLGYLLGNKSVLGHKVEQPFAEQVQALHKRVSLLFDALDASDVHRIDPAQHWDRPGAAKTARIVPAGVELFRQQRPFDIGFARAFLSPTHIAATGQTPEAFWADLEARCASASPEQLLGHQDWAVLHFRRGGERWDSAKLASNRPIEIGWTPSSKD